MTGTSCIIAAIFGGALAQLLMKAGLRTVSTTDFHTLAYSLSTQPKQTALILLGIGLYVMSMVVWVFALKTSKLNQAYPLLSLGSVVVYIFATVWPGIQEPISTQKSIGIGMIIFGVWYSQRPVSEG